MVLGGWGLYPSLRIRNQSLDTVTKSAQVPPHPPEAIHLERSSRGALRPQDWDTGHPEASQAGAQQNALDQEPKLLSQKKTPPHTGPSVHTGNSAGAPHL